jgi:hypothetical protein
MRYYRALCREKTTFFTATSGLHGSPAPLGLYVPHVD